MMSRAILRLPTDRIPKLTTIYGFDPGLSPALCGEDNFLRLLIEAVQTQEEYRHNIQTVSQSIPYKLAERRIYKPLIVISGDRVRQLLELCGKIPPSDAPPKPEDMEWVLRELAAIVDSEYFKPFFSFISKCIDELLQHTRDQDKIDAFIAETADTPSKLKDVVKARPPKHVVFSALPYKQLYKEPAVLVRVGKHVERIDRLKKIKDIDEFVRARIQAGMAETESKYATLWKMYVFMSDGLFYTGMAAPLMQDPCSGNRTAHHEHLKAAQVLVIRALRAAWQSWISEIQRLKDLPESTRSTKITQLLESPEETERINGLARTLHEFVKQDDLPMYSGIRDIVATGNVEQYVHTEDPEGNMVGRCTDIRYKYDGRGDLSYALQTANVSHETGELIKGVFDRCGRKPKSFGTEELNDIVSKLAKSPRRLAASFNKRAAQGEPRNRREVLQHIFRDPRGDDEWNEDTPKE
jgi:hypothetical protein